MAFHIDSGLQPSVIGLNSGGNHFGYFIAVYLILEKSTVEFF